jgi:hypothetical protein
VEDLKKMWKSKMFRTLTGLVMVLVLGLAMALPAMAEATATPTTTANDANLNLVRGKVAAIAADGKSFEVLTAASAVVVISVDGNTKYYLVNGTAAAVEQVKTRVQERVKEKQQNIKNNKNNVENQRGNGDNKGKNKENQVVAQTSQTTAVNEDDVNYEEDTDMEEVLNANAENQQGVWGKFKSVFNRNPKMGQKAAFADLVVGDGVLVKVMPNENLAKQVLIIKASDIKTVKGDITAVTDTTFTITPKDTTIDPVVLKWDANSRVIIKGAVSIKTGQYAVAVYKVSTLTIRIMDVFPSAPTATPTISATTSTADSD